jgi:uroporphyrinogen III methyltransferase / synthase
VSGTVYLIGGGPGDPGLVSERGMQLLRVADVVLYDRLSPPQLVRLACGDAVTIPVGKTAGDHSLPQDEINRLLVEHAQAGRTVVRLKGGDPYLFGRGGEEAAYCHQHGVTFEVVPGVTSAFAAPAAAGIPVTHRGVSTSVTVITASAGPTGDDEPDYEWLARSPGTVVLLMGLRRAGVIAQRLVAAGAPAVRPVAVISRGCTPDQRTLVATLGTLEDELEGVELPSPGLIVVGDVVSLRDELDWFERRPLFGRRIAVTRARAQASDLAARLSALGAQVVECPTIRIEPRPADAVARAVLDSLGTSGSRVLALTSVNAVEVLFEGLAQLGKDVRALAGVHVGVVGTATARACSERGIIPDTVPARHTSEGLLHALRAADLEPGAAVIVRASEGSADVVEGLSADGWGVELIIAYETVAEPIDESTEEAVRAADLVTFTAASTVTNLTEAIPQATDIPAVSIGPRTTGAATEQGYTVVAEAAEATVAALVAAVEQIDFTSLHAEVVRP